MPYIAFDLDALNRVPNASRACGLPEERITHGLLHLWAYCFREKTDKVSRIHLLGFFGAEAADALAAFGFLEKDGDIFRVRGCDRYLRLREGWSKGGKASKGNLKRGKVRSSPARAGTKPGGEPESSRSEAGSAAGENSRLRPGPSPSTEHLSSFLSTKEKDPPLFEPEQPPLVKSQTAAEVVFEHWRGAMRKNARAVLSDERRKAVEARIAEGFAISDLKLAVDGCAKSPWHMGENKDRTRYDDLELICRNAQNVERFRAMAQGPPEEPSLPQMNFTVDEWGQPKAGAA
jgi:hypothetical protein